MSVTIGIRELKNSLSRFLDLVRSGEEVVITDHGKPIAVIRALNGEQPAASVDSHLAGMAAQGLVTLASGDAPFRRRRVRARTDLSGAVSVDRDERE